MQVDNKQIHVLSRAVIIDQNHLLVCRNITLPIEFYFLPGGHIEYGEGAETALLRELIEETDREGEIIRYLGCLEYSFAPGNIKMCHTQEYNFLFEVKSDNLKKGIKLLQPEKDMEFSWIELNQLSEIDLRPEPLKELIPKWLELNNNNSFRSLMI